MARRITLNPEEWEVYLEDVDEEIDNPEFDEDEEEGPGNERKITVPICKALLVSDEMPPDSSVFVLKSVLLPTSLKLGQMARKQKFDEAINTVLRKSLKGWRNIKDGDGKDVPFTNKCIDLLPMEEATALANFVMGKTASSGKTTEDRDLGNG